MIRKIKMNSKFALVNMLMLLLILTSCSKEDPVPEVTEEPEVIEEPQNKTTGFISIVGTSSGTVATYFEELPTGTVDVSLGKDFKEFFPLDIYDHTFFTRRTDGAPGIAKMVVNADGEIVEEGFIATVESISRLAIKDSEKGIFKSTVNENSLSVFNPTTLEITGAIDVSAGFNPTGNPPSYNGFIFRGDDVFSPMRFSGPNSGFVNDYVLHQVNLATNTFVGDTKREGNGNGTIRHGINFGQSSLDSAGDLFMPDEGNYELAGINARVNKIPAGSNKIDPTYIFAPSVVLNPQNIALPIFSSFKVLENGKAVAIVNKDIPQAALAIFIAAGGNVANLTPVQLQQISAILFTTETAVWCELDLNAKTVTPIAGIPNMGAFARGTIFEHNGDMYLPVRTTLEEAYYKYSPATGAASKAFVMTGGTQSPVFYNIANNN